MVLVLWDTLLIKPFRLFVVTVHEVCHAGAALLTGGEALHGHHHDFPRSALNLPRKGIWNRIVDYNGTALLVLSKLRLARDLVIAPQFEPVPADVNPR